MKNTKVVLIPLSLLELIGRIHQRVFRTFHRIVLVSHEKQLVVTRVGARVPCSILSRVNDDDEKVQSMQVIYNAFFPSIGRSRSQQERRPTPDPDRQRAQPDPPVLSFGVF